MGQMLLIQTCARACVWGNQEDLSLLSPSMGTPLISFRLSTEGGPSADLPSGGLPLFPDLSDTVAGISNGSSAALIAHHQYAPPAQRCPSPDAMLSLFGQVWGAPGNGCPHF